MNYRYILSLFIGIDVLMLLLQTSLLSISYEEASILYGDFSFLQLMVKTSISIFGQNDFALRIPMITLHLFSVILLYLISYKYLKYASDRFWMIFIFLLSPGVISSALIVNSAGLIIFGLLLFIYLYERLSKKYIYILLVFYSCINSGFVYLFISLIFYSYFKRDKIFLVWNLLFLAISIYLYGFNIHGLPKGHFLDSLGLYSAIFTPMLFIYIFYILYRRFLTKDMDMLWFISSVTFVLSLILSFRQKIEIEVFASYLIIALPLAAKTFSSSYRVRLKIFRKKYRYIFIFLIIFLLLNSFFLSLNKELYLLLENPKKNFAYNVHIAKELAIELKKKNINCIETGKKMSLRLKFYGIRSCDKYKLEKNVLNRIDGDIVTVSYNKRVVYRAIVTKINNK